ncbi:MAG: 4Fe-4S binding protein [Pseudodesulfovibrio sp.]|nr:4Fe-4S binding protein [Pseudodesulfovibrio sp.]
MTTSKRSLNLICFSPTGTSRSVLLSIAEGFNPTSIREWDMTLPDSAAQDLEEFGQDLTIIGTPVYAGRVPKTAVERLKRIHANGTPAVLVATYGNRAFEDALLELQDITVKQGFSPVAGAAFIGEHSFSSEAMPIAQGRPDAQDLTKAAAFGKALRVKADEGSLGATDLLLPGNSPHREGWNKPPMSPVTNKDTCEKCGACAKVCPTGAIDENGHTDATLCIVCLACVRACPTNARTITEPMILGFAKKLHDNCSTRREPELFW